ncbi:MAG: hemerythrin family protein [Sedimenticola sp.]|nr:hemerythrin family protein [Sedimenticola sp.]
MKQTSTAQKISFIIAIFSYLAAIGCVVGVYYYESKLGGDHPVVASFGSAIVFFIGVGIVLHVIGRVNLPDLSMKFSKEQQDKTDD